MGANYVVGVLRPCGAGRYSKPWDDHQPAARMIVLAALLLIMMICCELPGSTRGPWCMQRPAVVGAAAAAGSDTVPTTIKNVSSISRLEYYVQVVVGQPYTGELVAPLDSSVTYSFGSMEVFEFNITAGESNTSQSLGHVRGYTVQASYTAASHEVEVEVVSYDDRAGTNGTLSLMGLVNLATNEIAIVGGSGSFRAARGYVVISLINPNVYHHSLYFL